PGGGPLEMHVRRIGVDVTTVWRWRERAKLKPKSIYGKFARAIDKAFAESWHTLHVMAANARPHELLFRRFAKYYPTQLQQIELSGAPIGPLVQFVFNQPQEVISAQEQAMDAQFVQGEESNVINLANYSHPPPPKPLAEEELAERATERELYLKAK